MTTVILVKAEHIEAGKRKYGAVRAEHLEKLLQAANSPKEVYKFSDNRILVVDTMLNFGLLYLNEDVFFEKQIL